MIQLKNTIRAGLLVVFMVVSGQARAQNNPDAARFFPRQGFMLSGYGAGGYNALFAQDSIPNNFDALFAPITLFQISDRFLFEGELEFEIEEGVTATDLEYAQIDVALDDNLTLVAGKFLLPFNVFSERLHPTWINRLVSHPPLYGHGDALGPTAPLIPVLSDIGVQLRAAFNTGDFSTVTAEAFISQGPMMGTEEHAEGAAEEGHELALAFGSNVSDNNTNKLFGGRIGYGVAPSFEANISGMTGAYDDLGDLHFSALGIHVEGRYQNLALHGEFIQTWQDLEEPAAPAGRNGLESMSLQQQETIETLSRSGYWVQLGYRYNKWQPVVRWTQLFEGKIGDEVLVDAGNQFALGIDYWIEAAMVLKAEYLINNEDVEVDNNRIAVQLAFGF